MTENDTPPVIIEWKGKKDKKGNFRGSLKNLLILDGEIKNVSNLDKGETTAPFLSSQRDERQISTQIDPPPGDSVVYEGGSGDGEKGALIPSQLVGENPIHLVSPNGQEDVKKLPSQVASVGIVKDLPISQRPVLYGPAGSIARVAYCGAKTRAGGYCKRPGMKTNGRCRLHGGTALRGVAQPAFKHGKYSKYLPEGMKEQYERSMADPELLSLNNELSIIDTRLLQLIKRLDKGESGRLWLVAGELYEQLTQALRAGSLNDVNKKMMALGEVLKKGGDEYGLWKEIGESMDRRRSLSEAERRRLVDGQYMIDVEKAKTLIAALAASVRKHVTDTKALSAISEDFLRLTQGSASRTNKSD